VSGSDCPPASELSAFVLGTLSEESLAAIASHLETCPACEAAVAALDQLSDPVIVGLRRPPSSAGTLAAPSEQSRSGAGRPLPERLGDYRIVREVGRGGMGIVFEAEQVSLGRRVALKVLPRHALLDPQSLERFQREARSAARLHHTNIVQVFGTGEQDGLHYFVMQLIRGVGVDHVIADLLRLSQGRPPGKRPPGSSRLRLAARTGVAPEPSPPPGAQSDGQAPATPPAELGAAPANGEIAAAITLDPFAHAYWVNVARLGIQVAEALAFAHAQGIVHRDVKPSNLLLDLQGRAWITDFGLAKESAGPADLTHSGFLVGTLRYLPPERFQGHSDARGDVYGLGLTLYELLALRPAFVETDRSKLVRQVMHDEPPRPRKLNPAMPRDLETVVLKAIARNPDHRYQAAADLAADLRRFVEDRPIRARRATSVERLWRWCRRNPTTAALLAALLLVLVTGFVAVMAQWRRAEQEKEETAAQLYRSHISQARLEWQLGGSARAEGILEDCESFRRGWEWHYLRRLDRVELFRGGNDELAMIASLDFSPDGRLLAFTGYDPYGSNRERNSSPVEVWDLAAGRLLHTLTGPTGLRVSFGADGRQLAVGGVGGVAQLWDTATGRKVREWAAGGLVTFSPDGRLLASGGARAITFWDPATGAALRSLPSAGGEVWFSPDGRLLAVSGPQAVEVREAGSGREVCRLPHGAGHRTFGYYDEECTDLAFSPNGRRLAGVDREQVRLWDVQAGQELLTLRGAPPRPADGGFNPALAWSPDGRRLAASNWDGSISVWEGLEEGPADPAAAWQEAQGRIYLWHLRAAERAVAEHSPTAAYHLGRVAGAEPPDVASRLRRARLFLQTGAWETAAADYSRAFAASEPEVGFDWLFCARLHLLRGDGEGYRRLCARLRAHLGAGGDTPLEAAAIRACVLGPGGVADPTGMVREAEAAAKGNPEDGHLVFALVLARCRAGQWQEALAGAPKSPDGGTAEAWRWWPVLALAHHHLGHADEARHWLDRAAEKNEPLTRRAGVPWHGHEMDFRILFAEAAALAAGRKP
jgi:tetratricopeptide (TPR) repeat protein